MLDSFLGLPLHPLVVHGLVVIGPLTAATAIVYAVRRRWRRALRWPLLVALVATGVLAIVVRQSGEALRDRLYPMLSSGGAPVQGSEPVWLHSQLGSTAGIIGLVWAVIAIVLVWWFVRPPGARGWRGRIDVRDEDARGKTPLTVTDVVWAGVLAAASIAALVWMLVAAHSGASATWGNLL
ncbi:DUF2231 domain-containing protein [Pseudoclavibacter endophyticus]|uniref:DUF2231 domain-containing protein n=1 Tax=Pseudoclavibacter endophyticus TaxID=1778590 RepID=A0A6H9WMH2_9MICO|nr:DUF2231 domain-containing protein [Pseudoclavibacter endophyticus]KAB1647868.1 hypothetical protein F8O04_12675 [Pseudoclavibacter endophyticus]